MDNSETYIKMCDCEEIQGLQPDDDIRHGFWEIALNEYRNVWLPRQDQLQALAGFNPRSTEAITKAIYEFRISDYGCLFAFEATMEQLWLAFVMKEKQDKVWNGTKWGERGS